MSEEEDESYVAAAVICEAGAEYAGLAAVDAAGAELAAAAIAGVADAVGTRLAAMLLAPLTWICAAAAAARDRPRRSEVECMSKEDEGAGQWNE